MTNLAQTISAGPELEAARGLLAAASLPFSDLTDEQLIGYHRIDRAVAPAVIRSTSEFSGLCPASSAFMFKRL